MYSVYLLGRKIIFLENIHPKHFYYKLAWEPSAAQFTKSYPRRLHAQIRFYRDFFSIKVDPLNLESQNQARNIPMGLPSFPIKI